MTPLVLVLALLPTAPTPLATVPQGGVARWTGLAAKSCAIYGKKYPAVDATCYYPVDLRARVGAHAIALYDQDGEKHAGKLVVTKREVVEVPIDLPPALARYVEVSKADAARAAQESKAVTAVLGGKLDAPRFSLPLGGPAAKLPPASADDFGTLRNFNAAHKSMHSGRDYPEGQGTAIEAVADGKVALVADHFYTGKAVYIDHGGGLVSMSFHLASISVKTGAVVKRGQKIGKVGATGRATGPHLHFGVRWLGQRVDPALLLASPDQLATVGDQDDGGAPGQEDPVTVPDDEE